MFSCFSARSTFTSRNVVLRTFASSSDSLNFFTATVSPVCLFRHFSTTPYAPSPTNPRTSYLFIAPPTPRSAAMKRKGALNQTCAERQRLRLPVGWNRKAKGE